MRNKLKDLRYKRNMTQQQLADLVAVSRQTIISLEGEKYNPSIFLAYRVAQIFHKKIEDVFIFEE